MQRKDEGVLDRGPAAIGDVRDKAPSKTAADIKPGDAKAEPVYVFASGVVDMGDKQPIPALTFVRVTANRVPRLIEVARRNRVGFVVCPPGWHPGR